MTSQRTIVIGSGAGGGVIAARLSEDADHEVILLEAGPDYANPEDFPLDLRDPNNPSLVDHDWHLTARFTEGGPANPYPRGKVTGGSTAVNGAVAVRGREADFAAWAEQGGPAWAWDQVLESYKALENDLDFGDAPHHGNAGLTTIRRFGEEDWAESTRRLKEDLVAQGVPEVPDINDPVQAGIGPLPRNLTGPYRGSTLVNYINPARDRANLEIRADTQVVKILVEDGEAVGVLARGADGGTEEIRGDRVVLCAGSIHSPHVLLLSGIGAKAELDAVGIPVVHDLPGVGKNLHDHPGIALVVTTRESDLDHLGFRAFLRWTSGVGKQDDLISTPGQLEARGVNFPLSADTEDIVILPMIAAKPDSRGWLSIVSADPDVQPDIHLNFLADERDLKVLQEGTKMFLRSITSGRQAEIIKDFVHPSPEVFGDDILAWWDTPAGEEWARTQGLIVSYHPVGTCKMGPAGDPTAVVDGSLKVHGLENLYVADASIMPEVSNGMTNLTAAMIGYHFVDILRAEEGARA